MVKFIIVTGGVISGIGKGITASSIGVLLQSRGLNVTSIKIDPYINVDAGTMSPYEHGECFVLKDGGEVDLDLGNYERFLSDVTLTRLNSITTGKVYQSVINKERKGEYLGKTVQIIPHITDEIQRMINDAVDPSHQHNGKVVDVCIIEVGGTVGDIETMPFVEALRQMKCKNRNDFCFVHVSMIVFTGGEPKTKPTQETVAKLRSLGIIPDILIMRTPDILESNILHKLESFCNVPSEHIISNINAENIYFVPNVFESQNLCQKIMRIIYPNKKDTCDIKHDDIKHDEPSKCISHFPNIINYHRLLKEKTPEKKILVIAGKYVGFQDTYLSLIRAIEHAAFTVYSKGDVALDVQWLDTESYKGDDIKADGIIIPGGFGSRGIKGKIAVAEYARTHNIPTLGICLGLQVMVVEFARNVCDLNGSSTEWDIHLEKDTKSEQTMTDPKHKYLPVIDILPDQTGLIGGTMRLGDYETVIRPDTKAHSIYYSDSNTDVTKPLHIVERHRHRYEVNNAYINEIESQGLQFVGKNKANTLMEIVELPQSVHRFYVGCQFHPEYRSKHDQPHPLFVGLMSEMIRRT